MIQRCNKNVQAVFIYEENSAKTQVLIKFFLWLPFLGKYTYHWLEICPFACVLRVKACLNSLLSISNWLFLPSFFPFSLPSPMFLMCIVLIWWVKVLLKELSCLVPAHQVQGLSSVNLPFTLCFSIVPDIVLLGPYEDRMPGHLHHLRPHTTKTITRQYLDRVARHCSLRRCPPNL